MGPQLHTVQIYMQPKPTCATGSLHMAAFSRKETQPTQRNNGGYAEINARILCYFNLKLILINNNNNNNK